MQKMPTVRNRCVISESCWWPLAMGRRRPEGQAPGGCYVAGDSSAALGIILGPLLPLPLR